MISRYEYAKKVQSDSGKQVLSTLTIPTITEKETDTYIITNTADRLDTLASKFYGNAKYWWVIAVANNIGEGTLFVQPGIQIRIPANPSQVIEEIEKINL